VRLFCTRVLANQAGYQLEVALTGILFYISRSLYPVSNAANTRPPTSCALYMSNLDTCSRNTQLLRAHEDTMAFVHESEGHCGQLWRRIPGWWGFSEKVVKQINKCSCYEKQTSGDGGDIDDDDCKSSVTRVLVSVRKSRSSRLSACATLYLTCNVSLEGGKLFQPQSML
jgi:hypothetical protein